MNLHRLLSFSVVTVDFCLKIQSVVGFLKDVSFVFKATANFMVFNCQVLYKMMAF